MIIMPLYKRGPVPPRVTADGITIAKGSYVWRSSYGFVTRVTMTSENLRHFGRFEGCVYSTERAAIEAALAHNAKKLKQAKQEVGRATKAIARLKARRAA